MSGSVYLVGAGPGAADLLTLRAARLLARADVVFHDALVSDEVLELAPRARKVAVGKRCGRYSTAQRFINKRLVDAAQRHAVVVRLKGGDPLLFGRGQEEIDALHAAGVHCEIVPGVSAAFAASAELAVSLTERGVSRSVLFATPRVGADQPESRWVESALAADTVALYMAGEHAREVALQLVTLGKPPGTPVALVSSASLPERKASLLTLEKLAASEPSTSGAPTLLLIGAAYARCLASQTEDRRQHELGSEPRAPESNSRRFTDRAVGRVECTFGPR